MKDKVELAEETSDIESTPKLTKWENEPSISDLQSDLESAESIHKDHVAKTEKWLNKLAGKLEIKPIKGRSKIQPKLIRKQAEWRYASLEEPFLSTDDLFDIDPRTGEDYEAAEDNQILLNYQFNTKIDKVAFINEYVRTCTDEGTVIVQVGWKYEKGEREVYEDIEMTPEQASMYLYNEVAKGNLTQEEAIATMQSGEPITKTVKRYKVVTIANHPTLRVCEYDRLIIDPTCEGDLDKAQFIIVPFETNYSELKKDSTYSNLDQIFEEDGTVVKGTLDDESFYKTLTNQTGFEFKDKARKKLTAYEYYGYWDIDGKGITKPIRATWVGNTMIKLEELPYPDKKLPFVAVQFMPVRKSIYGEPDGKLIEDNQDILGAVTRGMIDIMGRSANGQTLMTKGMLDASNLKKYENGEHAYINPGFDPRVNIHMQTYPEIPNSAMQMINMQNQEAESLTGVIAFSNGISGQALGNTATGVRSALDSASKRELGILRRLSAGLEKIGRKIIAMNAEFLDDEEVIRITNKKFRTIRRDDLTGDFDLRVKISTAESDNQKIEKLAFMMQTGQQSMDPEEAKLVRAEIYKLQKMPDLADKVLNYQPQPDPVQQEMQQLQLERMRLENIKLQSEIEERNSRAIENQVDVELKQAKTQNELAKAGKLTSEKDLADQEFIRRDFGVDHQQKMQEKEHDRLASLDQMAFNSMTQPKPANGTPK
mgnify:CR=1 FL=1